ncbi:MAG: hypothetical protein A2340_00600 [Lentisphaerae bacterium RIFOXYB12_FULL_60_10]|nr:MAG: hypothetical protein A2340_00600 [Lentisphaerae bacterium RIFOXYB12_FULL_60_10]
MWLGDLVDPINGGDKVGMVDKTTNMVNPARSVIPVIRVSKVISQPSSKRLVQQRLLQSRQRRQLALVERGEAARGIDEPAPTPPPHP